MKKSRLSYVSEIDEFLPQIERAQFNFTLMAAGQIKPGELPEESLEDLATINLLIKDLKDLKEDLAADQKGK